MSIVFNGGIIDKSQQAVDTYSEESARESLKLELVNYKFGKVTKTEDKTLKEYLEEKYGTVEEKEEEDIYIVTVDNYKFEVKKSEYETVQEESEEKIKDKNGDEIILTKENAFNYYGEAINYIGDGETENSHKVYRLFYVDFDGKYVDEKGTIYLKADFESNDTVLADHKEDITTSAETMKKMNPQWAEADGVVNTDYEKEILWLCNPNNWLKYKNEHANYAIGSVGAEMFLDSYNSGDNANDKCGFEKILTNDDSKIYKLNVLDFKYIDVPIEVKK